MRKSLAVLSLLCLVGPNPHAAEIYLGVHSQPFKKSYVMKTSGPLGEFLAEFSVLTRTGIQRDFEYAFRNALPEPESKGWVVASAIFDLTDRKVGPAFHHEGVGPLRKIEVAGQVTIPFFLPAAEVDRSPAPTLEVTRGELVLRSEGIELGRLMIEDPSRLIDEIQIMTLVEEPRIEFSTKLSHELSAAIFANRSRVGPEVDLALEFRRSGDGFPVKAPLFKWEGGAAVDKFRNQLHLLGPGGALRDCVTKLSRYLH